MTIVPAPPCDECGHKHTRQENPYAPGSKEHEIWRDGNTAGFGHGWAVGAHKAMCPEACSCVFASQADRAVWLCPVHGKTWRPFHRNCPPELRNPKYPEVRALIELHLEDPGLIVSPKPLDGE